MFRWWYVWTATTPSWAVRSCRLQACRDWNKWTRWTVPLAGRPSWRRAEGADHGNLSEFGLQGDRPGHDRLGRSQTHPSHDDLWYPDRRRGDPWQRRTGSRVRTRRRTGLQFGGGGDGRHGR